MIEILLAWILQCILIPDQEEFEQCLDNLIVQINEMVLDDTEQNEKDI